MKTWQKILIAFGLILAGGLWSVPVSAGVNDFEFKELDVEYRLSKDEEGRSVLAVKEKFIAVFPEFNQNRGIIRSIPTSYQGHSLGLKMGSIYRNGEPAPIYEDREKNGFRELTIRNSSDYSYLHGENEYEFNYTMRDVIMKPTDANLQEFYWDTNGTGWSQPFGVVRAKLTIDQSIADKVMTDRLFCYTGAYEENTGECNGYYDSSSSTFYFQTTDRLNSGANMSIAVGFEPNAFVLYKAADWEGPLLMAAVFASSVTLFFILKAFFRLYNAKKTQKIITIPVEYLPPVELDIYTSALFQANFAESANLKMLSAGLVDLAVNHQIKIVESNKAKIFGMSIVRDYTIEPLKVYGLDSNNGRFFQGVFEKKMVVGEEYRLKKNDTRLVTRMSGFKAHLMKELNDRGLIDSKQTSALRLSVGLLAGISLAIVFVSLIIVINYASSDYYRFLPENYRFLRDLIPVASVLFTIDLVMGIVSLVGVFSFTKLNQSGKEALTKLRGLERYIKMAEKDRLAFAQSVGTAERDVKNRIILYERLLPYAMLFGLEKSWNEVLGKYYKEINYQPDWYFGAAAFSVDNFQSAMKSFTSVVSSSYSSSSSGSGGGGFSGGGGGGGGGGGC